MPLPPHHPVPTAPLSKVREAKELIEEMLIAKTGGAPAEATSPGSGANCSPHSAPLAEAPAARPATSAAQHATPARSTGASRAASTGSGRSVAATSVHEARESLHRRAADSVLSIEGLLEDAHTKSWDAAIVASSAVRAESLSVREVRCCRRCNQGRLTMLLGRLSTSLWDHGCMSEGMLEQSAIRRKYLNALVLVTRLMPLLHEDSDDAGVQHMLWAILYLLSGASNPSASCSCSKT